MPPLCTVRIAASKKSGVITEWQRPTLSYCRTRDREKPGAKEGGGADLALLCSPEPLSRWIPPWAPKQKQSSLAPGFSRSPVRATSRRNGSFSTLRRSRRTAHGNRSTTIFTVWPVDLWPERKAQGNSEGQAGAASLVCVNRHSNTPPRASLLKASKER